MINCMVFVVVSDICSSHLHVTCSACGTIQVGLCYIVNIISQSRPMVLVLVPSENAVYTVSPYGMHVCSNTESHSRININGKHCLH